MRLVRDLEQERAKLMEELEKRDIEEIELNEAIRRKAEKAGGLSKDRSHGDADDEEGSASAGALEEKPHVLLWRTEVPSGIPEEYVAMMRHLDQQCSDYEIEIAQLKQKQQSKPKTKTKTQDAIRAPLKSIAHNSADHVKAKPKRPASRMSAGGGLGRQKATSASGPK